MTEHPVAGQAKTLGWLDIFDLWRNAEAPTENGAARLLAIDMGVETGTARQWRARRFVPLIYWPRLIEVVARRHGVALTTDDLLAASIAARPHPRAMPRNIGSSAEAA